MLKISPETLNALCEYPWPGNIREIETILERVALLSEGSQIDIENLPSAIRNRSSLVKGKALMQPIQSLVEARKVGYYSSRAGRTRKPDQSRPDPGHQSDYALAKNERNLALEKKTFASVS